MNKYSQFFTKMLWQWVGVPWKHLTDLFSVGAICNSLSSWRSLHGALQDQHHETCWPAHPGGHSPMADKVSNGASQPHALPYRTKSYSSARPAAQSVLTASAEKIANHGQKSHRCHKWPSLKKYYYYQHPCFIFVDTLRSVKFKTCGKRECE